jgi:hypothetical protein
MLFITCGWLLTGVQSASAGPLCPPVLVNTAYYLKNCCPRPCPVFDRSLYAANQEKLKRLQRWATLAGLQSISLQLLLEGVGQRIMSLPLVESPLASYQVLESWRVRECLSSPKELVQNNLLTPYVTPPETADQFKRRAYGFALSLVTENAPNQLSSVPERIARQQCRESLRDSYAMEQLAVAMSAQSTARAFKEKFYSYIRLSTGSNSTSCAPKNSLASGNALQAALSSLTQQITTTFGLPADTLSQTKVSGCLRQDLFINTQLRTDQALLRVYTLQLQTLYNMGTVTRSLPSDQEYGTLY